MAEQERITQAEAEALIAAALVAANTSPANAASVARALAQAEVDGQPGHGLARVATYAEQARIGKVDGWAEPRCERRAPAYLAVDARQGFAFPAFDLAIAALVEAAAESGLAAAGIVSSHHCGQAGRHVERLAEAGCLALLFANTPKAMAPWGGRQPVFGTNPIAFAAPQVDAPPLVVDLSLSKVARGKVVAAGKRGESIPEDWALDPEGRPTGDPAAALAGTMLPLGDAKGAALAWMVEILAAGLTGANFSFEASSFLSPEGGPPGVGQLLIVFDVGRIAGQAFGPHLGRLTETVAAQAGARQPGSRRLERRALVAREGLAVPKVILQEIRDLAGQAA
ncbi:MAG: Ldh family oxidoreductase [Rhodospirillales bacterium]